MKEQLINRYSLSKTLQFSLIPIGRTEENFECRLLLEQDEKRAEEYEKVKSYIDRYHRYYINNMLSHIPPVEFQDILRRYADLYYKPSKNDKDTKTLLSYEEKMRELIAKQLTDSEAYKKLSKKEMITDLLSSFLTDEEEKASVRLFENFTTYFRGFFTNRENMYSAEDQVTAIPHRCVNDNLPKFLDNCASFKRVFAALSQKEIETLNNEIYGVYGINATDAFSIDFFCVTLAQSDIDRYNCILGGYTRDDGTKVKGINEYINLYNQKLDAKNKSERLPLMKPLYKQILSDKESVSFIPEKFTDDEELLSSVKRYYTDCATPALHKLRTIFSDFCSYNTSGIFVVSGLAITELSNAVFGSWNVISSAWNAEYESKNPLKPGKDAEKYFDAERSAYKKIKTFRIAELQRLVSGIGITDKQIALYYEEEAVNRINTILKCYADAAPLFNGTYPEEKKLCSDTNAIELIKNFLDSIKQLEALLKPLLGTGKEEGKDEIFYGDFLPAYTDLSAIDRLYDKVRNYLTQKPYSKDKIKLNFENPQLLGGWDKNKEKDYRTVLLRMGSNYYLAVMDKSNSKAFDSIDETMDEDTYQKMEYKLLPGPNKMLPKVFFAASNADLFAPNKRIADIYKKGSFKKGADFSIDDCHALIDYFKDCIAKHSDWSKFNFVFKPTNEYQDISEFYNEIANQGYKIEFRNISKAYIDSLVEKGELYLFRLYNKDFSPYSKGTPNLHTLYFKMLFDERNLRDVVYKLNGEAEMFYRKATIKEVDRIIHPANQPVKNKNPKNQKAESLFEYDLIKDQRFTKRQFSLHLPITINFKAPNDSYTNPTIRKQLKYMPDPYIIGIDRGERNLLYICVINRKGEIVEQLSLNQIISDNGYTVDYHDLLNRKEKERDLARKSWGTIENIKELKEGYMSQVVHKICELVLKYDAVIAMEDLNSGFMNSRVKVEKQVYSKFEKMLTDKLNFLADKKADPLAEGGVLRAYQLTNGPKISYQGVQDGIIFYIPAWNTSKIDPTTGFVDLLKPKYSSVEAAKNFFGLFDEIHYSADGNMFEFSFNYAKFPRANAAGNTAWNVCTNGERIHTFRNPQKNSEWDNEIIVLTDAFKALFNDFGIDYTADLKQKILGQTSADFFRRLISLLRLTLQMRNSITGRTDVDYIISPVRNASGEFYDSRVAPDSLPHDADANGAYNIARKVLWAISVLKETEDDKLDKAKISITNKEWLAYARKNYE